MKGIFSTLEPEVEIIDEHQQKLQIAKKMIGLILDKNIYFNFEVYEEKLLANPLATSWTTIYRNNNFYPKIPLAIQQKKDTAITCGRDHLFRETGIVRSLRRDGYDVNHVKAIEE